MQTQLADFIKNSTDGEEADRILRKCVHCGFCTATCPTYQLLGDELDGPRGRIYLIKQVLEGQAATASTQLHLDRCLTCRNCESTCPSGVQYGRLVEIGRKIVANQVARPLAQRALRYTLAHALPNATLFGAAMKMGRAVRAVLPQALADKVAPLPDYVPRPAARHARRMLVLEGCVQPAMAPQINAAAVRVFDAVGISLISSAYAGCCGALRQHLDYQEAALSDMRRNIDAWWPYIEHGIEAIVMTASGCGAMVKEYGHMLAQDPAYAHKAQRVSALCKDICEVLEPLSDLLAARIQVAPGQRLAYHPPCTLQHGQQLRGKVEAVLGALGIEVRLCRDSHLCCGSAGTYSILQADLSQRLRDNKLERLAALEADAIVSANIGCLTHLQSGTSMPVRHWIEVIADALPDSAANASKAGGG